MSHGSSDIIRDGFASAYGRFYTHPGRVERVDGSTLRNSFLPRATPEGRKMLGSRDEFVRGQLKHYGVEFDESSISGNGTILLKSVLKEGLCDKFPENIASLEEQMHREWLETQTPEELSSHPKWLMEKYFLSAGLPDPLRKTDVVGIPLDSNNPHLADQLRETAERTIFMGWDLAAVTRFARLEALYVEWDREFEASSRDNVRKKMHSDYLKTLKLDEARKKHLPTGSYIIDCDTIENGWSDIGDMTLNMRESGTPGVFQARFKFGVVKGIMIISVDEKAVEQYCAQQDAEDESEDSGDDGDDASGPICKASTKASAGSKRKAKNVADDRGHESKRSRKKVAQPQVFHLRMRCRDFNTREIYLKTERGILKFDDEQLASFEGEVDIDVVGRGVKFTGRKISDKPAQFTDAWNDYSKRVWNYERVHRW